MRPRRHRWIRLAASALVTAVALAAARPACADWNHTPIALPLLGTTGPASPYPSRITIAPAGGASQTSGVAVTLHNVTHACPEDLVVLLVHGGTGYLLMSNAGGCQALQGTSITFTAIGAPLADNPAGPPLGATLGITSSVYGAPPTLPAPAPPGPYTTTFPGIVPVGGDWDLYVMDKTADNRGVVAAGWSLHYNTTISTLMTGGPVAIPDNVPMSAIPLDFTGASPAARVRDLGLRLGISHTFPDDLEIVLQSPSGTTAIVMADAGGSTDVASATLSFSDAAAALPADGGPLTTGSYRPGAMYGPLDLAAPAGPHGTSFAVFDDEPVAGIWRLWINDDAAIDVGTVNTVQLVIGTELLPPLLSIDTPTSAPTLTSTQTFLNVGGEIEDMEGSWAVRWRNVVDGAYYASGAMRVGVPPSDTFEGAVPLKHGTNVITVTGANVGGAEVTDTLTVTVPEYDYYLSEGATGAFFDTSLDVLTLKWGTPPGIDITYLPEGGAPVSHSITSDVPPLHRIDPELYVPAAAFSTVMRSLVPLSVERNMFWDATKYGGHGGSAVDGASTRWLFAEGAQGFFDTYILLANDNASAVTATVRFLRESGGPVVITPSLPAHSRTTIWAGSVAGVPGTSFGIEVTATAPIIAERAMYFPSGAARPFEGGTGTAGVTSGSTTWFLAEGATGPFFECFVLVSNPNPLPASVTFTYLLPSGATLTRNVTVAANARLTVNVETVDPILANTPVSTTVTANRPIVVERAMYWPDISLGWQEAHDSFGVTEPGLRWAIAGGRLGGAEGFETYLLLANPNPAPAEVIGLFVKMDGTIATRAYTLAPTSRRNIAVGSDIAELGAGDFGAIFIVDNFQPIVVEKAMYWNSGSVTWAGGSGVTATRIPPP
jgi:subtilisin-like proprotein convertase family protein